MANIRRYALWLNRVSITKKQNQRAVGIPVAAFSVGSSRGKSGGSVGEGKVRFDELTVMADYADETSMHLAMLVHSGANLGGGRLEAVMDQGPNRNLLAFEDSTGMSITQSASGEATIKLYVDKLRTVWRPPAN